MPQPPATPLRRLLPARLLFVYLGLACMVTQMHTTSINVGYWTGARAHRHALIIDGEGRQPWAYRVLTPYAVEYTAQAISPPLERGVALETAYVAWRGLATFAFLCLFHLWLCVWVEPTWAVAGTLLAGALHPASYQFYWFQPDSPPDLVVWTLAALLTVWKRDRWLAPLVVVGTLNRETAVFAIGIHAVLRLGQEPLLRLAARCVGLGLLFLVPFYGLRALIPAVEWTVDLAALRLENATVSWWAILACFLAPIVPVAMVGLRRRPVELQRLLLLLVCTYVPLQLVFGRVREVRLFLPLVLPLIPLVVLALREALTEPSRPES